MRQQQHWPYLGLHRSHERLEPVCHVNRDGVGARIPVWTAQPHKAVTESNPSLPCSMANALCHHGFRQRLHARVGTGVTKAVHEHHGADGRTGGSNEGLCRTERQMCQANFKLTPHCAPPARHSPALASHGREHGHETNKPTHCTTERRWHRNNDAPDVGATVGAWNIPLSDTARSASVM